MSRFMDWLLNIKHAEVISMNMCCANCKWWDEHKDTGFIRGMGECIRLHQTNANRSKAFLIREDEDELATTPDFYCNEWEIIESEQATSPR